MKMESEYSPLINAIFRFGIYLFCWEQLPDYILVIIMRIGFYFYFRQQFFILQSFNIVCRIMIPNGCKRPTHEEFVCHSVSLSSK